jgi:stage V sporulation protein D (sporulation-specific penicillin-binding protein)
MAPKAPNRRPVPPKAAKASKEKRKQDTLRRAKAVIQRRTIYLMLGFGVAAFLALFAKAYDLTINQHDELQARASRQQTSSTTISASRGTIYDRNGVILAKSATADTVFLDPVVIKKQADALDEERAKKVAEGLKEGEKLPVSGEEYKDIIAKKLAEILELEEEAVREKMEKTWSMYETLRTRVDRDIGDEIRAFIADNETGRTIQGIHLSSDAKRYYPYGALASHVIGFLDGDNKGAYGLEAIYEEELQGTKGVEVTAKDANGSQIMFQYEQHYDAEDGNSLQLTLDANIQSYLERGLEDMVSKFGGKYGATGVVMDPRNGAILAIASNPNYDVNEPRQLYTEKFQEELAQVDEEYPPEPGKEHSAEYYDKLAELQKKQWRSKAVNDTYEPGSTFKVLTLAMGLEEGVINLNSNFYCGGSVVVDGEPISCSNHSGHGSQNLKEAVGHSCNPAFISIGLAVGSNKFYDYMLDFGLQDKTGVDLQGDVGGILIDRDIFVKADIYLATNSFGQTFNVTPLQLITAQSACINGGYLYTPYVVEKELDSDGNVIKQHDATPVRQVISEETSATVRDILEYVVSDGGGRNGQVAGYRIGGKTGTADKTGIKDENGYNEVVVSFMCFAPADDPQVIMLLTLDTPSRFTGTFVSGGNMAAPTASAIMSDILPYLGIAPQYDDEDAGSADSTVPYVVGLTKDEAAAKLTEYGFSSYRTVGDGDTVTDQTPVGGAIVPASAEIILYMGAEKSGEPCTVPNVVGLSASEANKAITNAGLIMKSTGASGTKGIKAISQSLEPEKQVPAGTVVTVQMGQTVQHAD